MNIDAIRVGDDVLLVTGQSFRALKFLVNQERQRILREKGQVSPILERMSEVMSDRPQSDTSPNHHKHNEIADPRKLLSAGEVAKRLGTSDRHVRRLAPKLGGYLVGGRWLIDEQAVQDHIQGSSIT